MKISLTFQTTRLPLRYFLFYALLCAMAVNMPTPALCQSIYSTPYTFTTLAGLAGNPGTNVGTGSAARFNEPAGVAVDSAGNVYVADYYSDTIRKVTPAGVVTTLAGRAGTQGGQNGTGSGALFNLPNDTAVDTNGNIYVADSNNKAIRKVTSTGVVTTLAGGSFGSTDGTNGTARFEDPSGVAVDTAGNVYVADWLASTIRKVTPVGTNWVVTTLAGLAGSSGSTDGTNSVARFKQPSGVAVDSAGNLYVADEYNDTIRKMTPMGTNWVVTTLAGTPGITGSADGTNGVAQFAGPEGVAVDGAGNVYVADTDNHVIRKVTPAGMVTTLAGLAGSPGSTDGTGSNALFNIPTAVAVDSNGNLYIADLGNDTIRQGFPASSVPAPILQSPNLSAGHFTFGIAGLPNLAVKIESSTNLTNWQAISTIILTNGTYSFTTTNPPPGPQFYRVQVR